MECRIVRTLLQHLGQIRRRLPMQTFVNINGNLSNLYYCIASFLSNRFQRVKVGSALSENRPVVSGVTQGSVVAAILFNLFINDLTDELEPHIISKLFADDVTVYTNISYPDSHMHFQSALDTIMSWSSD